MKEIKQLNGKHTCGQEMDMRYTDLRDTNKYILYGVCDKCKEVVMMAIFEGKPVNNRDFIIDYNKKVSLTNKLEFQDLNRRNHAKKP